MQDTEISAEEKRLREIEESKFLGGDVEHTHLVKGLDYALLQKVSNTASQLLPVTTTGDVLQPLRC